MTQLRLLVCVLLVCVCPYLPAPASAQSVSCEDGSTCRDINNPDGYCDLTTGECVNHTSGCPEFYTDAIGMENKCTVFAGLDPATGLCLYQPKVCAALGCNRESCDPATGACAVVQNNVPACGSTGNFCRNRDRDGTPCDFSACNYWHCQFFIDPSNCNKLETVDCAAENPSTCQLSLGCTPGPGDPGSGCEYTVVDCAPPADPCAEELVLDGTATGCCTYRPKDCAAEFGDNPHYTYSCTVDGARGVCHADNEPPDVLGHTLFRQAGAPGSVEVIATVSDDTTPAGDLLVALDGPVPDGITISQLTNDNGTISAFIAVSAGAAFGPTVIPLDVTDGAGAVGSGTFTVMTQYDFTGFFPPVDNPPTLNSVKAGQAIPVKFSLGGDFGLDILAAGSPSAHPVSCDSGATAAIEETTLSNSGLTYDAATQQYTYVWKTQKGWAGDCRELRVTLNDGATYTATFKFK